MTEHEDNLWARRRHGRHADLYDAEYAKQLERIARIRSEVSAALPARGEAPAVREDPHGPAGDAAQSDGTSDGVAAGGRAGDAARGGGDPRDAVVRDSEADDPRDAVVRDSEADDSRDAARGDARRRVAPRRVGAAARWDAVPVDLAPGVPAGRPRFLPPDHGGAPRAAGVPLGDGGAPHTTGVPPGHGGEPRAAGVPASNGGEPRAAGVHAGRPRFAPPRAGGEPRAAGVPASNGSEPRAAGVHAGRPRFAPPGHGGEPHATRAATRDRRAWVVLGGAVALTLVAGVVAFLLAREPEPAAATVFHVPGQPTGLATDQGRVWVAGPAAGEVWVLDQASGRPVAPAMRIGGTPARLALDPRFAWIADTERSVVVRAPREGDAQLREIRTGPDLADVAVAGGQVWTASSADGTVRALDARGRREVLHVGARPIALAGDATRIVVLDATGSLIRLDAIRREPLGPPVDIGGQPVDVALAGDIAWVADHGTRSVRAVSLTNGAAGPPIVVGRDPVAIAADDRDVYVLCRGDRTLVRLDPDGALRSRTQFEHAPTALALDPRHVWIAAGTDEVIRVDR